MNVMPTLALASFKCPTTAVTAGFRPESIVIGAELPPGVLSLGEAKVTLIEPLGSTSYYHLSWKDTSIVAEYRDPIMKRLGEKVHLGVCPADLFFFDSNQLRVSL